MFSGELDGIDSASFGNSMLLLGGARSSACAEELADGVDVLLLHACELWAHRCCVQAPDPSAPKGSMITPETKAEIDTVERRGPRSLAAQVVYQARVIAILRDNPELAALYLRDPVLLAKEYARRYEPPG